MSDNRYAPLTWHVVCSHQTRHPGAGIELGGGMAIGFMPIPLGERYRSFCERLDAVMRITLRPDGGTP